LGALAWTNENDTRRCNELADFQATRGIGGGKFAPLLPNLRNARCISNERKRLSVALQP
jgi:hypothetical protein